MTKLLDSLSEHLSEASVQNITKWLTKPLYAEYRDELVQMIEAEHWQDLEDAFFKVIEFGTGGRRGRTGVGSNRINKVTMGESAQALCQYAKSFDAAAPQKGIAIACDTRLSSPELSKYCAQVCAANGFKTYLFDGFRSTPELSFALRELKCAAGIVVSASHNQPTDNGFKAYWNDGAQLVPPHDTGVLELAEGVTELLVADFDTAVAAGDIVMIGEAIDHTYITTVVGEAMGKSRDVRIVYSPLHGAGQTNALPVLKSAGFQVSVVTAQMVPDGNFPTIENNKPNPEEPAANDMAVAQLMAEKADIAITNDPDADRIGVVVRQGETPIYLNGNQSAALAADYVLGKLAAHKTLGHQYYMAKTIVTTEMLQALADYYGVSMHSNLLIGFKYIGELIHTKEGTGQIFVMGGEESYGLLKGTYARDKDGAIGALMLAEYAAELKADGKTLYDRLLELFSTHGVYAERLDTVSCPGADGFARMQSIMNTLRTECPTHIGSTPVTKISDYSTLEQTTLEDGSKQPIQCAKGNVVVLECGEARCRVTVRPSGTEPKLKFYTQWYEPATGAVAAQYEAMLKRLEDLAKELEALLLA